MNEWGFIDQESLVAPGKLARSNKFEKRPGHVGVAMCERRGWCMLIPTYSCVVAL